LDEITDLAVSFAEELGFDAAVAVVDREYLNW
jgi:hypothetical protein